MRRTAAILLAPLLGSIALACGGSAFTTGGGDAGTDATGPTDGSGGGGDATEASVVDAPRDVQTPPPATCSGTFACVPSVPSGWAGPLELYSGASASPSCTADFAGAYDGNDQLTISPASCNCSCTAPTTQCVPPELELSEQSSCSSNCYSITLQPAVCTTVKGPSGCATTAGPVYISAANTVVGSTSCAPQLTKQVPPPDWTTNARACASATEVAQVDCQSGSVCAPKPAAPYAAGLCISKAGDQTCPAGSYSTKHTFYGSVSDSRDCVACTCGALTGASCSASFSEYSSTNGSCSGLPDVYAAPVSCSGSASPADFRLDVTSTPGSCTASQGSPTGTATPASPTTFCCLP